MKKNIGTSDRLARAVGGVSLLTCSFLAPLPLAVRVAVFATMDVYLLMTALVGTCGGYALMGKSSCPPKAQQRQASARHRALRCVTVARIFYGRIPIFFKSAASSPHRSSWVKLKLAIEPASAHCST